MPVERPGMFSFRPITISDKPALEGIAQKTWDGTDYLPYVLDDWLSDSTGEFTAVLAGERLVGCGKMTFLTPTDVWFEGLRKDPDAPYKGVAAAVTAHFLSRIAGRQDLASIRFATYFSNRPSIVSAHNLGFRRIASFSWKSLEGKSADLRPVTQSRVARTADENLVRRFLESSSWLSASGGLLVEGWKAIPYSWELFAERYLRSGHCGIVMDGGRVTGLSAAVVDTRYPFTYVKVVFLEAEAGAGAGGDAGALLLDEAVSRAGEGSAERYQAEIVLPPGAAAAEIVKAKGFSSMEREGDFLVYEYPLAQSPRPAPARARRRR